MTPIEFYGFASYVFYGLIGFVALALVKLLSDLNRNVHELNVSIAVVLERVGHQEKAIEDHDNRLKKIESVNQ